MYSVQQIEMMRMAGLINNNEYTNSYNQIKEDMSKIGEVPNTFSISPFDEDVKYKNIKIKLSDGTVFINIKEDIKSHGSFSHFIKHGKFYPMLKESLSSMVKELKTMLSNGIDGEVFLNASDKEIDIKKQPDKAFLVIADTVNDNLSKGLKLTKFGKTLLPVLRKYNELYVDFVVNRKNEIKKLSKSKNSNCYIIQYNYRGTELIAYYDASDTTLIPFYDGVIHSCYRLNKSGGHNLKTQNEWISFTNNQVIDINNADKGIQTIEDIFGDVEVEKEHNFNEQQIEMMRMAGLIDINEAIEMHSKINEDSIPLTEQILIEKKLDYYLQESVWSKIELGLDVVSFSPELIGTAAEITLLVKHIVTAEWGFALLSIFSLIPGADLLAKPLKWGFKALKGNKVLYKKLLKFLKLYRKPINKAIKRIIKKLKIRYKDDEKVSNALEGADKEIIKELDKKIKENANEGEPIKHKSKKRTIDGSVNFKDTVKDWDYIYGDMKL